MNQHPDSKMISSIPTEEGSNDVPKKTSNFAKRKKPKKIGKPKKKNSWTWQAHMANQQNIEAPNHAERTEASSNNYTTIVDPQSIPPKRSADEKWMVQRKLNCMADRIAKAKIHEQSEMTSAAKRLVAVKEKSSIAKKNAKLLFSHEREHVSKLVGKRRCPFQKSEVVKAKNNMERKQREYLQRR